MDYNMLSQFLSISLLIIYIASLIYKMTHIDNHTNMTKSSSYDLEMQNIKLEFILNPNNNY